MECGVGVCGGRDRSNGVTAPRESHVLSSNHFMVLLDMDHLHNVVLATSLLYSNLT